MKSRIIVVLALLVVLSCFVFVACNSNDNNNKETITTTEGVAELSTQATKPSLEITGDAIESTLPTTGITTDATTVASSSNVSTGTTLSASTDAVTMSVSDVVTVPVTGVTVGVTSGVSTWLPSENVYSTEFVIGMVTESEIIVPITVPETVITTVSATEGSIVMPTTAPATVHTTLPVHTTAPTTVTTTIPTTVTTTQAHTTTQNTITVETTVKDDTPSFVGTYWSVAFGPTNGSQYIAKVKENGKLLVLCSGSGEVTGGKYVYNSKGLRVEINDGPSMDCKQVSDSEFVSKKGFQISGAPAGSDLYYGSVKLITDPKSISQFEEKVFYENTKDTPMQNAGYYEYYKSLYSMTQDEFVNAFPGAKRVGSWSGCEVYDFGMNRNIHFSKDKKVAYVYVPFYCLFTDIKSDISKKELEQYTEKGWVRSSEKVPLDMYNKVSGYVLSPMDSNYQIMILCDSNGNVDYDTARCQILK